MTIKSLLVALALVLGAGCEKTNPYYCANAVDKNCANGGIDAPANASCAVTACATGVCDTVSGTCVQCTATQSAACTMTTPVCGSDNTCHACVQHSDCPMSNVCMPSGACADPTEVAYVSASGTGTACTKGAPCPLLSDALAKSLPMVKIAADGAANAASTIVISGKTVTILAEKGAKLDRDLDGPILTITDANTNVSIYDLELTGATGVAGDAIDVTAGTGAPIVSLVRTKIDTNAGLGVSAVNAGSISIAQSNITNNASGGISITGGATLFTIINNFITYNGTASGPSARQVGGAALLPNTATSTFVFNTVAYNGSDGTFSPGVTCSGAMVVAANNLSYHNTQATTTDDTTQKAGSCQFGNTVALGTAIGDMGFVSPTSGTFDFHLTTTTPVTVLNAAGECSGIDIDGQSRPQGGACDLGADELMQ